MDADCQIFVLPWTYLLVGYSLSKEIILAEMKALFSVFCILALGLYNSAPLSRSNRS